MGPFTKLQKPCKAVMLYRTTGFPWLNAGIEDYCARLEEAINGSNETKQALLFEQIMIDLLLPLSFYKASESRETYLNPSRRVAILDVIESTKVLCAVCALQDWYSNNNADGTEQVVWLHQLKVALADEAFPRNCDQGVLDNVLRRVEPRSMLCWAAGLVSRNPFC